MKEWFALLIMLGLVVVILGPLFWSLHRATIPLAPNNDNWIVTRRSVFDHVIGTIQFGFSAVWLVFGIAAPFFMKEGAPLVSYTIFALMLVLGSLFLYSFLFSYAADVRFNDEKIEYKAVFRRINAYWNEVTEIRMGMNGPAVHTAYGNFSISNTRCGFYQLLDMARKKGVKIQDSPYLKPRDNYWPYKKKAK